MKREGYPLPWCVALDCPYWVVNFQLIGTRPGWFEYQKGVPISQLIPEIDRVLQHS